MTVYAVQCGSILKVARATSPQSAAVIAMREMVAQAAGTLPIILMLPLMVVVPEGGRSIDSHEIFDTLEVLKRAGVRVSKQDANAIAQRRRGSL
jgi:hypothetical protein